MKLSWREGMLEVRIEGETALLAGRRVPFRATYNGQRLETIRIGEEDFPVRVARDGDRVLVWCAGSVLEFRRAGGRPARKADASGGLAAPMPGRVRKIFFGAGDRVSQGDVVLILEAMKMEHAIRAPREGIVVSILHGEGELVEAGEALAEIRETGDGRR